MIAACAAVPRDGQKRHMDHLARCEEAYIELHGLGYAHSVETWFEGKLVGGLYGVSLGKAFFGESMFHRKTDASKVALATLVEKLKSWDFHFVDSQMTTEHMISLGAKEMPRRIFLKQLELGPAPSDQARQMADRRVKDRIDFNSFNGLPLSFARV